MPENAHQTRRNLGRNSIKPLRTAVNTALLRYLKKSEKGQSTHQSLRTAGLGLLALAWSVAVMISVQYAGSLGARYGHHVAMTRALKHDVSMETALVISGSFGVLWLIGAVLIAWIITCTVALCFVPKRTFRIGLFGYYMEEDGQEVWGVLFSNAVVAAIYTGILLAINYATMGLLTDMVHVFGR